MLPPHADLLFVTPHRPGWIERHSRLILCGEGTWRVGGESAPNLWVAANALPLHPALLPVRQLRSGSARVEFVQWIARRARLPAWFGRWMEATRMNTAELQGIFEDNAEPFDDLDTPAGGEWLSLDEVRRVLVHLVPELGPALIELAREEGREEGREQERWAGLQRLCALRLGRPLSEDEGTTLRDRMDALGVTAIEEVAFQSSAEALERWLAANAPRP